ncbi:MAG: class II fructose-bisphosphate aldolase [Anaerolineales bacterium]|nr:class II fructose-bisphosphate aldolase [Anaerolineales bacterium]
MANLETLRRVAETLGDAITIEPGPTVTVRQPEVLRQRIAGLVRIACLGAQPEKGLACWLVRELAVESGALPASIDSLYLARGAGKTRNDFSVPAMNLRALPFQASTAVFRAARAADAQAILFEIARSEIGYTDQRPAEYAACVLGAAIAEGYRGPVFIQGDHFQVSAKKFKQNPTAEVEAVKALTAEAITAGFFNIDIDTSTLVDLDQPTLREQQRVNFTLCAEFSAFIRQVEPPGVVVSIGGEIGEVGGHNSTEPELRAFMDGYKEWMPHALGGRPGLSKISIQTGTSHGGVVLPDGTIAKAKVDFGTLQKLSLLSQRVYKLGGAVQHGASTLPEEAFTRFAEANALEVHLATNFQNMLYDRLPELLRQEMYAYLAKNHPEERKEGQTDEQFYYAARKRALGPFKRQLWEMSADALAQVTSAWEQQFGLLFQRLNIRGTRAEVTQHVKPVAVRAPLAAFLRAAGVEEDVRDLAD